MSFRIAEDRRADQRSSDWQTALEIAGLLFALLVIATVGVAVVAEILR